MWEIKKVSWRLVMFHHLRSHRKQNECKKLDVTSSANLIRTNDGIDNEHKCKERPGLNLNTTEQSHEELTDSEHKKAQRLYSKETSDKRTKQSIRKRHCLDQTKYMVKNALMNTVRQSNSILNIPKKRFRNAEAEAFCSFEQSIDRTYDEEIAKKKSTPFRHSRSIHRTKTKKSLKLKKTSNTISTNIQTSDCIEPSTSARIARAEKSSSIQDSSDPDSAPNSLSPSEISEYILVKSPILSTQNSTTDDFRYTTVEKSADHFNTERESEFINENPHNCSSNLHVNSMNPVSSDLSNFYTNQDANGQNTLRTEHMQNQPFYSTIIGAVTSQPQTYVPLNSMYTYMTPNPMTPTFQQVSEIQETLKTVIENLNQMIQAQKKLQNTQNDIIMELQKLKMQNSAYENRENWLAENNIHLPMKCKEEFTKLCTLLEQSTECRKIFEISIHFNINSKKSLTRNIASVIRKFFVSKLANQFTAVRCVEGKSVLADTSFYKHLLKNFLEKSANGLIFPGLTETDFNKALGEVLCNSKDWKKKKTVSE